MRNAWRRGCHLRRWCEDGSDGAVWGMPAGTADTGRWQAGGVHLVVVGGGHVSHNVAGLQCRCRSNPRVPRMAAWQGPRRLRCAVSSWVKSCRRTDVSLAVSWRYQTKQGGPGGCSFRDRFGASLRGCGWAHGGAAELAACCRKEPRPRAAVSRAPLCAALCARHPVLSSWKSCRRWSHPRSVDLDPCHMLWTRVVSKSAQR